MREFKLVPAFCVHVFGNWTDVISVRLYRDQMIDQKPHHTDPEEAEHDYRRYSIPCNSAKDLVEAYSAFSEQGLVCEFAVSLTVPGNTTNHIAKFFAATGLGYGDTSPAADVSINETEVSAKLAYHVDRALDELRAIRA